MKLNHIAEGWFNSFLDSLNLLDENIKALGKKRMNICLNCPVRTNNRCDGEKTHINITGAPFVGCGCNISKKTLCVDCQCPGGFW